MRAPHGVGDRDDADGARVRADEHDGPPLLLVRGDRRLEHRLQPAVLLDEPRARDEDLDAPDLGPRAAADEGLELRGNGDAKPLLAGVLRDGRRERMLGERLDRGREPQHLLGIVAPHGLDGLHDGAALGQGPRLVEGPDLGRHRLLEVDATLDQEAMAGGVADAGRERHRGRDDQRARAREDDERERPVDPVEPGPPHRERRHDRDDEGDDQHDRGVPAREAVDEVLHGRPGALGFLDEVDDARERGVRRELARTDEEGSGAVDGAREDLATGLLGDGDRFPRDGRLVNGGAALHDDAVHGHALAGAHQHHVVDLDLVDGERDVDAVAPDRRHPGGQVHQAADRVARALGGGVLEPVADGVQERDHRTFAPGADGERARHADGHERVHVEGQLAERDHARAKCAEAAGQGGGDVHRDDGRRVLAQVAANQPGGEQQQARDGRGDLLAVLGPGASGKRRRGAPRGGGLGLVAQALDGTRDGVHGAFVDHGDLERRRVHPRGLHAWEPGNGPLDLSGFVASAEAVKLELGRRQWIPPGRRTCSLDSLRIQFIE